MLHLKDIFIFFILGYLLKHGYDSCCYLIFDPCFDKLFEKTKNSKKTTKTLKNAFLIYLHRFLAFSSSLLLLIFGPYVLEMVCDRIKELISYPKCRSVEVINNPARPGLNHREVNYIEL